MTQPTPPQPVQTGERTHWDQANSDGGHSGWYPPGEDWFIRPTDTYWQDLLNETRSVYGDPNIRYNTDNIWEPRYLQFGDGTPLPVDGTVMYHNTDLKQNIIRNEDGTFSRQDFDGNPIGDGTFSPVGYRQIGDSFAPVDAHGHQIAPQQEDLPGGVAYVDKSGNGILTPANTRGDYYTIDPATGQAKYFDAEGNPISADRYLSNAPLAGKWDAHAPAGAGRPDPKTGTQGAPLQSTPVVRPPGMAEPRYPEWASLNDPDIPNQMTAVMARLYTLFGSGTPVQSELPEFPFNTASGDKSGIDSYDAVKKQFLQIETQFDDTAKAYRDAVAGSAVRTEAGREAINSAIGAFNSTVANLPEGSWSSLLAAESTLLDQVKAEVVKVSGQAPSIPSNPDPAPGVAPQLPATPPEVPGETSPVLPDVSAGPDLPADSERVKQQSLEDLIRQLGQQPAAGSAPMANPLGMNPLGGLGGMNPLGGLGGMNPLSPLGGLAGLGDAPSNAVTPLAAAADGDQPVKPLAAIPADADPVQPISSGTPIDPMQQATPPGPFAAEAPPAEPPPAAAAEQAGYPADADKPMVTLPDGKVIEADDPRAAQAAQAALDGAGPGGDAAQKAYSETGLDLPSDGKNPGAKIDPADMQPGDVLKWADKTMVAVAPGLVADPVQPGVTHTLQDVLRDPTGFQGVFRPTETHPTLSGHSSPPPLQDPAPPAPAATPPSPNPENTIPLSSSPPASTDTPLSSGTPLPNGPAGQAAPPSPFESSTTPPPATRSTKAERIAAGQQE